MPKLFLHKVYAVVKLKLKKISYNIYAVLVVVVKTDLFYRLTKVKASKN